MREFFTDWFGRHSGREIFKDRSREFIDRSEQLEFYVQYCHDTKQPAYVSVQPFSGRDQPFGLEKLFFDFDCKGDLSKAWKEAMSFSNSILKYYSVKPLLVASGHKGYHVYVFFNRVVQFPTFRSEFIKSVYEEVQKRILIGLSFETLDPAPLGDIKRLARVPYSVHEETGNICQPLNVKQEPLIFKDLDEYRMNGLDTEILEVICKEIKVQGKWEELRSQRRSGFKPKKTSGIRPCVEAALLKPLHGGAGHKMRLGIVSEYLYKGFSVNQTVGLFRPQTDFNESKTRYFVTDASKKGYKPFKCKTIRELSFCLGEACPIFRKKEGYD